MSIAIINKALLLISKTDLDKLLNGLITQNIQNLNKQNPIHTLFLNNKGRVLFCSIIYMLNKNNYILETTKEQLMPLAKHIHKYDLDKSAQFQDVSNDYNIIISEEKLPFTFPDPRSEQLMFRGLVAKNDIKNITINKNLIAKNETTRLKIGLFEQNDYIFEKTLANTLNPESFNAIDFNKGCYLGQEITSKTKHIKPTKDILIALNNIYNIKKPGETLLLQDQEVGKTFSFDKHFVLAIIKRKELENKDKFLIG